MNVTIVVGTRPQIIKSAHLIHLMQADSEIDLEIIHTGQHYDYEMTKIFFKELSLPKPTVNLEVGSSPHVYQLANIMDCIGIHLHGHRGLVIVPGDTNSALAAALAAAKMKLPVAHIEAGARSHEFNLPEEINRRLIDHCSSILFAPTFNCFKNLETEGVLGDVYLVGDTLYDAFLKFRNDKTESNNYIVLTLHRPENVDNISKLRTILKNIIKTGFKTIFPVHPRTKKRIDGTNLKTEDNIEIINPLGYPDFIRLLIGAHTVVTDSGGVQKEAFWGSIPCVTVRQRTEWPETLVNGCNRLVDADGVYQGIMNAKFSPTVNPFGDGHASEAILEIIKNGYREV